MDILQRLDQAFQTNPDPDYIAYSLNNHRWMRLSDVGRDFWRNNRTTIFVIGSARKEFYILSEQWVFYSSFTMLAATGREYPFWIIRQDQYEPGSRPNL